MPIDKYVRQSIKNDLAKRIMVALVLTIKPTGAAKCTDVDKCEFKPVMRNLAVHALAAAEAYCIEADKEWSE